MPTAAILLSLLLPSLAFAQPPPALPAVETFENGVPATYMATGRPLAISELSFKSGSHSLLWSWENAQDSLLVRDAARLAKRSPKSGFAVWVHNGSPRPARLAFDLLQGDKIVASGWFWMDYHGWRLLGANYAQLGVAPGQACDGLRVHPVDGVTAGRLFLDDLNLNFDYSPGRTYETPWVGMANGLVNPPLVVLSAADPSVNRPWLPARPKTVSVAEKADIARLETIFIPRRTGPGRGLQAAQLASLRQTFASYRIRRQEGEISGRPIDGGTALRPEGYVDSNEYTKFCEQVKNGYYQSKDPAEVEELRRMFVDLTEHLLDQGWGPGNRLAAWDNYPAGSLSCFYAMQDVLAQAGLADMVARALMDNYGSHSPGQFTAEHPSSSMDGLGYWNRELFACSLMFADESARLQHLRISQRFLDLALVHPDTIAPDGCVYHHGGFHYAYASYNLPRLIAVLRETAKTQFRMSPEAQERLRTYVKAISFTFSHGEQAYNLGMRAGTPMGSGNVPAVARDLAEMGTPDGSKPLDELMAGIALWLLEDLAAGQPCKAFGQEPYKTWLAQGIKPRVPSGFLALNGAPVAIHRRPGWVASIAGISPFWRGLEIYGWTQSNNYGRYARHGSLCITANGTPPGLAESGWRYDGWNWCHFPGTTALRQPAGEIFDGYAMYGNGSPSAGGTSLGQDGLWGMEFRGVGACFSKTYFCFGNRITSVTTGIRPANPNGPAPVVTTLFQNAFLPEVEAVSLDGEPLQGFPRQCTLDGDQAHWLLDNKGNGYLIPAGNDPVKLSCQPQEWLYIIDKFLADPKNKPISGKVTYQNVRGTYKEISQLEKFYRPSTGIFALAYFDHGRPQAASCLYTIVVKTTPEEMKQLAARPAFECLRRDDQAHVVHDLASQAYGYALYQPSTSLPAAGPLRASSRPCFLMFREDNQQLQCSLAYTGRRNTLPPTPETVRLTLAGHWRLAGPAAAVKAVAEGEVTAVEASPPDNTPFRWTLIRE